MRQVYEKSTTTTLTTIFIVFSGPVLFLKPSVQVLYYPSLIVQYWVTFDLETEIDFHKYKTFPQCELSVCKESRVQ